MILGFPAGARGGPGGSPPPGAAGGPFCYRGQPVEAREGEFPLGKLFLFSLFFLLEFVGARGVPSVLRIHLRGCEFTQPPKKAGGGPRKTKKRKRKPRPRVL